MTPTDAAPRTQTVRRAERGASTKSAARTPRIAAGAPEGDGTATSAGAANATSHAIVKGLAPLRSHRKLRIVRNGASTVPYWWPKTSA